MDGVESEAKSMIEKILGDVSKTSAVKQIALGASSGWLTGFMAMRIGRTTGLVLGGSVIAAQVAYELGYIKINWNKVNNTIDKVVDKIEEKITDQQPTLMDKAERYVDRKLTKAEKALQGKAKRWYSGLTGDSSCQLKEVHIFLISFAAGVAIGIGTS